MKESFRKFDLKEFSPSDEALIKHNIVLWMKFEPFLAVPKETWEKLSSLFPFSKALQSFTYSLFAGMAVFMDKYLKNSQTKKVKE